MKSNKIATLWMYIVVGFLSVLSVIELNKLGDNILYSVATLTIYTYLTSISIITMLFILGMSKVTIEAQVYLRYRKENLLIAKNLIYNMDMFLLDANNKK